MKNDVVNQHIKLMDFTYSIDPITYIQQFRVYQILNETVFIENRGDPSRCGM
jgi:hypothetical protein